jgi:hypothetical protein
MTSSRGELTHSYTNRRDAEIKKIRVDNVDRNLPDSARELLVMLRQSARY